MASEKPSLDGDSSMVEKVDQSSSSSLANGVRPPSAWTPEEDAKLYRKLDWHIVPILSALYFLSFLDRGNIGNARLQKLEESLGLVGNQFNLALTIYFIPYCVFEFPSNLLLKKFRPSRWLPFITMMWGIVTTCSGLVKNYHQLITIRFLLGLFEAGLFPGVVYYLTLWYPRAHLQMRIGLFFGTATLAGAFSGLLAYGISFMSGVGGLLGWSWIFILEGLATVIVGFIAFFVLVDYPDTAKFLNEDERARVIYLKKYDGSSVGEEEHFDIKHIKQAFGDWQIWLHILIYYSIVTPLYGITLFLPSIIHTFGYTYTISQLLTVPPYAFATIVLYTFAYLSDKHKIRSPFVFAAVLMCLCGFAINISNAPAGVKYFGTFLAVAGSYSGLPGTVAWMGNNLSGSYKRGVGMALQIGIGNFAGAFASNIYRSQDSPRYLYGHGFELMFVGIGLICIPIAVISYTRINASRDAAAADSENKKVYTDQELRELGDRSPEFRYYL